MDMVVAENYYIYDNIEAITVFMHLRQTRVLYY